MDTNQEPSTPDRAPNRAVGQDLAAIRRHLGPTLFGGALLVAGAAHLVGLIGRAPAVAAGVLLAAALVYELLRELARRARRYLWRISRKLFVSYLLIGLAPVILVVLLSVLLAYVAVGQFISLATGRQVAGLEAEVKATCFRVSSRLAEQVRKGVDRPVNSDEGRWRRLDQDLDALRGRFAGTVAHAVVVRTADGDRWVPPGFEWPVGVTAGRPSWLRDDSFADLVVGRTGQLEVQAAKFIRSAGHEIYVEVAVPLDTPTLAVMQQFIGVELGVVEPRAGGTELRELAHTPPLDASEAGWSGRLPVVGVQFVPRPLGWANGQPVKEGRLIVTQRSLLGLSKELYHFQAESTFLITSLLVLVVVGLLVFESAALGLGGYMARSVTGSVEELSQGTQRIERGDLDHRILQHSDDQLGDLSRSFNRMAVAVSNLVRESAERERLEEELRIGRRIQQSLLPKTSWRREQFEIAAFCLPAREVGGDYFDLFELEGDRLAMLVADVSGKGTEAAFYMAEVKGILLALSRQHADPRAVLTQANRLLANSLDAKTFVTMSYAVLHLRERRLDFARAGHNPLIHLASGQARAEEHRPDGMALGVERLGLFDRVLQSRTVQLKSRDIVLFYTDGVTETMGVDGEFYGQPRLLDALATHRHLETEPLRDALVADLARFARPGPAHDDVTLVVLRVL